MSTTVRKYNPATDFSRVRQFLIETFALHGGPVNWMIDQWNFARYFSAPVHVFYSAQHFSVPVPENRLFRDEISAWEDTIYIWEDGSGQIAGVVNSENEEPGDAFVQIHPAYAHLYPEMVDLIEDRLADVVDGVGFVKIYVNRGTELENLVQARGYRQLKVIPHLEYKVTGRERPELPDGFTIKSVADCDNIEERRKAKSISFGANYGPSSWPPAWTFREMQKAPDYRPDLDLYIEAQNGDCASFCTVWVDPENGYANIEPLGTRADYQGLGLAGAMVAEAFRRMAGYGVTRSFMQSENVFYRKVGFQETPWAYAPWIKYLDKR